MTDCSNAEMRDRLPDLLHERLDSSARAAVMAHVAQCAECRAELTLLREARIALTSDMRAVDVASITRAVMAKTSQDIVHALPRQRRAHTWMDWRVAASIALLAIGGASYALIHSRPAVVTTQTPTMVAKAAPQPIEIPTVTPSHESTARAQAPARATSASELSAAGGVGDLSDNDLRALLDDLQSIDAEPPTDPDPVSVRVTLPGRERGGRGTD